MARVKLIVPGAPIFRVTIPVRITDINYGNHVGNDRLVGIIHEARVLWLQNLGYSELDVAGVGLIMSDLAVVFKREIFYGQQMSVSIHAGELTGSGFELYYQVQVNEQIAATVKTGLVCFDYDLKKVVAIPPALVAILST